MRRVARRGIALAAALFGLATTNLAAQAPTAPAPPDPDPLDTLLTPASSSPGDAYVATARFVPIGAAPISPGDPLEDRLRTMDVLAPSGSPSWMIRSTSSATPVLRGTPGAPRVKPVLPRTRLLWNSALPFSQADDALWSGRGWNVHLEGGARAEYGPLRLFLLPELVYSQNQSFQVIGGPADRSTFLPPWRRGDQSADLPHRFGDASFVALHPGQSSIAAGAGGLEVGLATENQWWGPGIRNAIVMSDNAPGFPHAFLRTRRPLQTPLGTLEARWIAGALGESLHFDTISTNDTRSLSGAVAALTPRGEPGLTLGLSRVVYAPVSGASAALGRALDFASRWDQSDPEADEPSEQIFSLFGRWVFPADGFEVYAEWARTEFPASLREVLSSPARSQGYTLGLQWARPFATGDVFRVQSELTYLEKADPPTRTFYTSARVPQGYTHRGQVLGAAIGPGASSQWLAFDYLAPAWQAGVFVGRIRWDNDAYYTTENPTLLGHDVSVFGGLRATGETPFAVLSAELSYAMRYNYLFQNEGIGFDQGESVDVGNTTLKISVVPGFRLPRVTPPPAPSPPPPAPAADPYPAPGPPG